METASTCGNVHQFLWGYIVQHPRRHSHLHTAMRTWISLLWHFLDVVSEESSIVMISVFVSQSHTWSLIKKHSGQNTLYSNLQRDWKTRAMCRYLCDLKSTALLSLDRLKIIMKKWVRSLIKIWIWYLLNMCHYSSRSAQSASHLQNTHLTCNPELWLTAAVKAHYEWYRCIQEVLQGSRQNWNVHMLPWEWKQQHCHRLSYQHQTMVICVDNKRLSSDICTLYCCNDICIVWLTVSQYQDTFILNNTTEAIPFTLISVLVSCETVVTEY
jgi:hypothetical protein